MLLRYYMKEGKRVYTMKMNSPEGECTLNAHPARFSPDDKFSQQRVELKKRFGLLPTQCQQLIQLIMHQEEEISIDNFRLASFMKKDDEAIDNNLESQKVNTNYDFTYFSLISFGISEYFIFYIFLYQDSQSIFNNLYFITRACSLLLIFKFTKTNQDSFQKIFINYFNNLKQKQQLKYFVICQLAIWLIICCCKNLILLNTFLLLVKSKLFYSYVFKILRGFPLKNHYYKFCLFFSIFLLFVFFKNETYSLNIMLLVISGILFVYQEEVLVTQLDNNEPLISVHFVQACFGLILLLKNIFTLQIFLLTNITFKELLMILLLLIFNTLKYISYKKIKLSKNNISQSFYQVQIQLLIVSTIAVIMDFIFLHNQFKYIDFFINIIGYGSIIFYNKNFLLLLLNKKQNGKLETQLLKSNENNQQIFQINLFKQKIIIKLMNPLQKISKTTLDLSKNQYEQFIDNIDKNMNEKLLLNQFDQLIIDYSQFVIVRKQTQKNLEDYSKVQEIQKQQQDKQIR